MRHSDDDQDGMARSGRANPARSDGDGQNRLTWRPRDQEVSECARSGCRTGSKCEFKHGDSDDPMQSAKSFMRAFEKRFKEQQDIVIDMNNSCARFYKQAKGQGLKSIDCRVTIFSWTADDWIHAQIVDLSPEEHLIEVHYEVNELRMRKRMHIESHNLWLEEDEETEHDPGFFGCDTDHAGGYSRSSRSASLVGSSAWSIYG